jgi:hypothetical protein
VRYSEVQMALEGQTIATGLKREAMVTALLFRGRDDIEEE